MHLIYENHTASYKSFPGAPVKFHEISSLSETVVDFSGAQTSPYTLLSHYSKILDLPLLREVIKSVVTRSHTWLLLVCRIHFL